MTNLNRRNLITKSIIGLGAIGASLNASASLCRLTANQPEGPFYPEADQLDKDSDLTTVVGRTGRALGEVVLLQGLVQGTDCRPIAGALVEIWQACESGKYNHSSDPNDASLDPNFQYWGRAVTNATGEYQFKTIKPGSYQASPTWVRPPHIHFKVHLRGHEEITSQLYFSDETRLNAKDRILQSLGELEQNDVIVNFKKDPISGKRVGRFDITLKAIH